MVKDQRVVTKVYERKLLFFRNYGTQLKVKLILFTLFLLFFTFAATFQYLSAYFPLFSCRTTATTTTAAAATTHSGFQPPLQHPQPDQILQNGVVKRRFLPFGSAAYSFILMSAYRGGPNTFAVIGLSSKPLHVYGRPSYTCEYQSQNSSQTTKATRILPDWGFGRVYTVVVINCTFSDGISSDSTAGGRLLLHIPSPVNNSTDTVAALTEPPNSWAPSQFLSLPKYDFLYCGSPLYGNLSPQRIREWLAYHVRLFGDRSHFVIYDAGGVHKEVREVLKPWMELGYVSLLDVVEEERFDGYYHNQFLIVNDCLHRHRFDARWMFFFDVDEYIFVPQRYSLRSVVDTLKDYTQFTIEQIPISNKLCLTEDTGETPSKWAMEKLVYRNVKKVARRDRKYAVQPRNVLATGVHLSRNFVGESAHKTEKLIKYYHYHGTIVQRQDTCKYFVNESSTTLEDVPYVRDTNMRPLASLVKRFEFDTIGSKLQDTKS